MLIDTHCHLEKKEYENVDEIIEEALTNGINKLIANGYDCDSSKEVLELINKYDNVYGAIGFAPSEASDFNEDKYNWLEEKIRVKKIVAIGEIGLDYHWYSNKEEQKELFKRQLDIASKCNKPVIIHNREASDDIYEILSSYNLRGMIHCFSGNKEMADKFISLGFYLSIGGIITFKNSENLCKVIKDIPLEYIVLETDSPYLSPEPKRGLKNRPSNMIYIARKIAEIKRINQEEVAEMTTSNVNRLFDL